MRDEHWTSEAQIHYPLITETALSPDGTCVVYAVREPLMTDEESRFLTQLYLVSLEDGEPVQLTWGPRSSHHARWSPDGQFVAFLSDRPGPTATTDGKSNLYVMRVRGGEPWALTAYDKTSITDLAWSPDGGHLAFLMEEPPTEEELAAEKAKDDLVLWGEDFDFRHVYVVPFAEMPRELPEVVQLTGGAMHVRNFAWLPDGGSLALTVQPTPRVDDWTKATLVSVPWQPDDAPFGPDRITELAMVRSGAAEPFPSPDGTWIACVTEDDPPRWAESNGIALYPVAGGEPRMLPHTPDGQCWVLGWSSDGSTVYAMEHGGLDTHVWALPATGEAGGLALSTETYKFAFSRLVADRLVFAEETFTRPNRLMVWHTDRGTVDAVTAPKLPPSWPASRLPKVDVLQWSGADGMAVEGTVVFPMDYEPGDRVPLVVFVHGGPAGVFLRRYLAWPDRHCDALALAEAGIAVLKVNPRGSSGYGREFRFANYGDWGGGDYRDIMAGVDLLVERGIADPERLGIMGWSYGGYMTSWTITQTDRFKAAVVGAGVTNLMSFTGTADIPGFLPDYFGAEPWEDLETYLSHSAMGHVQGVTTPTLIQHGAADDRVPLSQGREFYNALKRQGVETQMVIYPRQAHSITEPRFRLDVRRRAAEWMIRWLVEEGGEGE